LPSVKATGGVSAGYPVIAAAKRQREIKRLNLNVRRNGSSWRCVNRI